MDDFEEIPVETVEGSGRQSPLPERLAVALAALALLGGLLIAGANLLGSITTDEAATASDTPGPTATAAQPATPTPRPSSTPRPLREVTVEPPGTESPAEELAPTRTGWLEVVRPVPLKLTPSDATDTYAELEPGSVLLVTREADSDWVQAQEATAKRIVGWLHLTGADGSVMAVFHPIDAELVSGWATGVWSGPSGLVARVDLPHAWNDEAQHVVAVSADGERWRLVHGQQPTGYAAMAYGPAGWITSDDHAIWNSYDGVTWDELGELFVNSYSYDMGSLTGSAQGYLAAFLEGGRGKSTVWFSPDGITWQESPDPFGRTSQGHSSEGNAGEIRVIATEAGFVAWTGYGSSPHPLVAISDDGYAWRPIGIQGTQSLLAPLQLMASSGHLLAIAQAEANGALLAWSLDLDDPSATELQRDAGAESMLTDLGNLSTASDGHSSYIFGTDAQTFAPRLYVNAGEEWHSVAIPSSAQLGPQPMLGAVGPQGLVLIGARANAAGFNPVFWHLRSDGSWAREAQPVVPTVPDPSPSDCGPVPSTALEFALLPPAWGPVCFGHQPMTFTAWAAECGWCGSEPTPDPGEPSGFLVAPPDLALRPAPGDSWPVREVVFTPTLTPAVDFARGWVRLTGHYADPAADSCGISLPRELPADEAVRECRQRFVVTAISVVDGP